MPTQKKLDSSKKKHLSISITKIQAITGLGDAFLAFLGMLGGFWLRFNSGLIPLKTFWFVDGAPFNAPDLKEYQTIFGLGIVLLIGIFAKNSLYEYNAIKSYKIYVNQFLNL